MSKKPLFIGAVASIIAINSVLADTTVTSKTYVDTTRQATIPVAGTNANTPGSTVVTYTGTAGQIGERGIYNGGNRIEDDKRLTTVYGVEEMIDGATPTGAKGTVPVYNGKGYLGTEERGIYDGSTTYDSSTDSDKLVTASALQNATNLPTITTSKMTCVDSPDCTLWAVADQTVYGQCLGHGQSCGTTMAECAARCCDGASISCSGNNCRCYSSDVEV